ncbi:hypothetical protein MPLA_1830191 [Mesorhizobium sp. ORS 3359]|nr:hypothetical protein MPLA_1830191 [Mesorhizobium sp. ORS 3359]
MFGLLAGSECVDKSACRSPAYPFLQTANSRTHTKERLDGELCPPYTQARGHISAYDREMS